MGMLKSMLKPMINHPQPEMGWISIPNLVVCGINALPHYVTSQVLQLFHNHGILQMIPLIIQITFTYQDSSYTTPDTCQVLLASLRRVHWAPEFES